jgi:hypothetical protein
MIGAKMKELSTMDEAPNVPGEAFPFTTSGVYRWFKARGGKERSGRLEKPVLTEEHIRKRIDWASNMTGEMENKIIVHLDEKWFYYCSIVAEENHTRCWIFKWGTGGC